jgi:hypothetical protein
VAELAAAGHRSDIRPVEPGLTGIGADPPVAIGQRSLLVSTPEGNLLWDPSGFIDDAAAPGAGGAPGMACPAGPVRVVPERDHVAPEGDERLQSTI